MPAEQDKIATLRQAAAAKREAAAARAETGIRKLTKTGQPVTFRAVAAASGVSVDFLYRHPELRARIERLRGHQPAPAGREPASQPGNPGAPSVVATLTARLTELRRELAETKAQLAAAHGELLALRRHPRKRRSRRRIPAAVLDDATLKRVINDVTWPFTCQKLARVR